MKGQEFENFEFDSYKQRIDLDLRSKVINPCDDLERKSKVRSEIMHYFYKHPWFIYTQVKTFLIK